MLCTRASTAPSVDCGPSGIIPKVEVLRRVPITRDVYAHPFSSYCQKVLIALYENDTPFDYLKLDPS